jgi:hypothetical protein
MTSILKALGYLWAAPTTILCLIFFLFPMWALGQITPFRWSDGAWDWVIVQDGWFWKLYTLRGWAASTLGWAIFYSPGYVNQPKFSTHERRHVLQNLILGPTFILIYLVFNIAFSYQDNPLEVDARNHEQA